MTRVRLWWSIGLLLACGSRSDLARVAGEELEEPRGGGASRGTGTGDDSGRPGEREDTQGGSGSARGGTGAFPERGAGAAGRPVLPDSAGSMAGGVDPDRGIEQPEIDWNAAPECAVQPPSLDQTLSAALADLMSVPAGDRPFMRYVSTGYRRTVDCESADPLANQGQRDVALLGNLLSAAPAIASVSPVDAAAADSLVRIDLRSFDWQRAISIGGTQHRDGWEAMAAQSALAVELTGPEGDALRAESATRFPLLPFVELLVHGTRGEVYYELLDLPDTLSELAERLQVPLNDSMAADWMRGGTTRSSVVREQRGVARYRPAAAEAPFFWLALDFSPASALPGVFLDPLSLDADSKAALFMLPNGLPGFFTADAAGQRVYEAPLMTDTSQPDFVARIGVSCIHCHAGGPFWVDDEVRELALASRGAGEAELLAVDAAYPPAPVLRRQAEADTARVGVALAAAGGTVQDVNRLMQDLGLSRNTLSLARAAGQLFVGEAELRASLPALPPALAAAAFSGSIARAAFERSYVDALCALHQTSRNRPLACP